MDTGTVRLICVLSYHKKTYCFIQLFLLCIALCRILSLFVTFSELYDTLPRNHYSSTILIINVSINSVVMSILIRLMLVHVRSAS